MLQAVSTGSLPLTDEQKSWLTGILNQNTNLVADTQTINKDLVGYNNTASSSQQVGVQALAQSASGELALQSIDGTVRFLALMGGEDAGQITQQITSSQSSSLTL